MVSTQILYSIQAAPYWHLHDHTTWKIYRLWFLRIALDATAWAEPSSLRRTKDCDDNRVEKIHCAKFKETKTCISQSSELDELNITDIKGRQMILVASSS